MALLLAKTSCLKRFLTPLKKGPYTTETQSTRRKTKVYLRNFE